MEQITTICYGKKDTWQSREEAQAKAYGSKGVGGQSGQEKP